MLSTRDGVVALMAAAIMAVCTSWAGGQQATGDDTAKAVPRGSPQDALRTIGVFAHPQTEAGTATTRPAAAKPAPPAPGSAGYSTPHNIPMWSPNLAQPRELPAKTPGGAQQAAGGVPDEDDLRTAGLRGPVSADQSGTPYVAPSIGGYRGFGAFGYGRQGYSDYRRSLRWPAYTREWTGDGFNGRPGQRGFTREDAYTYGDGSSYFGDGYGGEFFGTGPGEDRGYFEYMGNARTESLLKSSMTSMDRGLTAFREGRYREAADAFRLACDVSQGDPAARIYAAHALFATGRYRDGVKFLRMAFELQPRIAFLTFDMRNDYRNRAEFTQQVAALQNALNIAPHDEDRLFMMGYIQYFGGQRESAYYTFQKLTKVNPRDKLAAELMENCQPPDVVTGASTAPPRPR